MNFDIDFNTLLLFGIAALNAFVAYQAQRTRADVHRVEVATNSMKDAQVAAKGATERLLGREEARIEGEQKAATLAEGVLAGKESTS